MLYSFAIFCAYASAILWTEDMTLNRVIAATAFSKHLIGCTIRLEFLYSLLKQVNNTAFPFFHACGLCTWNTPVEEFPFAIFSRRSNINFISEVNAIQKTARCGVRNIGRLIRTEKPMTRVVGMDIGATEQTHCRFPLCSLTLVSERHMTYMNSTNAPLNQTDTEPAPGLRTDWGTITLSPYNIRRFPKISIFEVSIFQDLTPYWKCRFPNVLTSGRQLSLHFIIYHFRTHSLVVVPWPRIIPGVSRRTISLA